MNDGLDIADIADRLEIQSETLKNDIDSVVARAEYYKIRSEDLEVERDAYKAKCEALELELQNYRSIMPLDPT